MIEIRKFRNNNHLRDNGYSLEEEADIYDRQLDDIIANPRWYLDNLEFLFAYRVSFKDYRDPTPTLPFRYVKHRKTDAL